MADAPKDRSMAPQRGDAADPRADLWLGRQLWLRRVERAGVTTGASAMLRRAAPALPLLAALHERRELATAHLGQNPDRAAMTAPSRFIREQPEPGTIAARSTASPAPATPGAAVLPAPAARSGDPFPPATKQTSPSPRPAQGHVIQRRAVTADSGASPLPRATPAAADHRVRAARPFAAVMVPSSADGMAAPRRVGAHRVGAPVKGAIRDFDKRPGADRPMPKQPHDATRAGPVAATPVISPYAATVRDRDPWMMRPQEAASLRSDAATAASYRPLPASAAAAHQATAVDPSVAESTIQHATARSGPHQISEVPSNAAGGRPMSRLSQSAAMRSDRMAMRGAAMPVPTVAIAAPMAMSGSLPRLTVLPLAVRNETMIGEAAAASPGRDATMPLPPSAMVAPQPVQQPRLDAAAGAHKQVRSIDAAAPASTAAPSGSAATALAERARLSAPEIGRVAERVYQLLVDRLAQERQRRGA